MSSKCSRGFTRLEFVVAIIIISTLYAVLLDRMSFYQELAEKAAVEQMAITLRSALHAQIANKMIQGQTSTISALAGMNPMDWLDQPPSKYVGELDAPEVDQVAPGSWYFDLKDRHLVYVVLNGAYFTPNGRGRKEVRFTVQNLAQQNTKVGKNSADTQGAQGVNGVILVLAESYVWF